MASGIYDDDVSVMMVDGEGEEGGEKYVMSQFQILRKGLGIFENCF